MQKYVCPRCSKIIASSKEMSICKTCGAEMLQVSETLLATVPDRPGALAELLQKIAQKGINLRMLHAIPKEGGMALAFFSVDRAEEALTIPEVQRAEDLPIPFQKEPLEE